MLGASNGNSTSSMRIFHFLFMLSIGGAFLFGGWMIAQDTAIPTYRDWQAMQTWQSAEAELLHLSPSHEDVQARYRYTVAGITYQNDRVYVSTSKDNIGDYHAQLQQHLSWLKQNGQRVPIWYDQQDPQQAVIDRDMRWGLFALMSGFCAVFMLIGSIIIIAALKARPVSVKSSLKARSTPAAPANNGESPWLNDPKWRHNSIQSDSRTGLYSLWIFVVVWIALTSTPLFVMPRELEQGNYAILLALIFPLFGLVLIRKVWRQSLDWRHYGPIPLRLDPFPGAIGGHVGGTLQLSHPHVFKSPCTVTLECIHRRVSGSGKNRSQRETIKWAEQGTPRIKVGGRGAQLQFRFDVPDDLPESASRTIHNNAIIWRLTVSNSNESTPLHRQYHIPVFKTATKSSTIRHDNSAQAAELRAERAQQSHVEISRGAFERTALARALRYSQRDNRHVFYFPMFRNGLLWFLALIFAAGFDFAAYMINTQFADEGLSRLFMLLFSLPFALVGLIASIAVIYLPLNNLKVTFERRRISSLRRLWLFPIFFRTFENRNIDRIEIKKSGSTGQGVDKIQHYRLIAHAHDGKRMTLAEDIDGEALAQQLRQFMLKLMGRKMD